MSATSAAMSTMSQSSASLSGAGTPTKKSSKSRSGSKTQKRNMIKETDNTIICFSPLYNVTLVRVNLLDALMDDGYFVSIVKKFSRPGEKCLINVDINATIIFGDLIAKKDEAHVLTSTMFETIAIRTPPATAASPGKIVPKKPFLFMGKVQNLLPDKSYSVKKLIRQMFSKEEARKAFNPNEANELLKECFACGQVAMGEKIITLEDFQRLYHGYYDKIKRTVEKGGC